MELYLRIIKLLLRKAFMFKHGTTDNAIFSHDNIDTVLRFLFHIINCIQSNSIDTHLYVSFVSVIFRNFITQIENEFDIKFKINYLVEHFYLYDISLQI